MSLNHLDFPDYYRIMYANAMQLTQKKKKKKTLLNIALQLVGNYMAINCRF